MKFLQARLKEGLTLESADAMQDLRDEGLQEYEKFLQLANEAVGIHTATAP